MSDIQQVLSTEIFESLLNKRSISFPKCNLLDVTLRDGGFLIGFKWEENFIREFVREVVSSGIKKVEIGYLGGVKLKSGWYEGISANFPSRLIYELTQEIEGLQPVAIVNPWRTTNTFKVEDYKGCGLSMLRVAYSEKNAALSWDIVQRAIHIDIPVCLNITSISQADPLKLIEVVEKSSVLGVKFISFADTTSSLQPSRITEMKSVLDLAKDLKIELGFHGHDVLGFGNANALSFIEYGVTTVDVSVCGIGRGGKNLCAEIWSFLSLYHRIEKDHFNLSSLARVSKLISNEFDIDSPDFISLACAIFQISPEKIEGLYSSDELSKDDVNLLCTEAIQSAVKKYSDAL